jgi:hypothetical protein
MATPIPSLTSTPPEATISLTPPLLPGALAGSPTDAPSATLEPFLADTPTPFVLSVDSFTPTATPQLSPVRASAAIQIQGPGPLSKVLSPIHLHGYIVPGYRNMVRVELYGEDGRLIMRKLAQVYTDYQWAYFSMDISFETHAAAELARLQISTEDKEGRTTALTSVHLLLLPEGYEQINPPGSLDERCVLFVPWTGAQVSGGTVSVGGKMRPFNGGPLIVELVTPEGNVVGMRLVNVTPAADDGTVTFSADVPYTVLAPTPSRLTVRQLDERIPGTIYLYSQEILLNP